MQTKLETQPTQCGVKRAIRNSMLRHVMRSGGFLVPEIAEDTGYSLTTIAKYVAEMQSEGSIVELDRINLHARGRRAVRYGVDPGSCYFLGIDMRNFGLSIGLMNFVGDPVRIERCDDFRFANSYDVLDSLCNRVERFVERLEGVDRSRIAGANLNLPGRVDSRAGTSATTFHFEDALDTPLADLLSERLGLRLFIENDTKAMAYGEYCSGLNRRYENALVVNIGWGIGLGIIADGRLYYGKNGYSGELGHIHAYDNDVLCHCGKKGCLETEVSGQAVLRKLTESIRSGASSLLAPKVAASAPVTIEDLLDAVEREDPLCIELVSRTGSELGRHLAGLINLLNPEVIVIGGPLARIESCYFLRPAELSIRKYALKLMSRNIPIETSALGADAGVIGACLLARSRIFGEL